MQPYHFCYLISVLYALLPRQIESLRCKCNTNRGPTQCMSDFCDIHSRDGKRAACGALRRAKQTIFSCVLIRQNSNDTYCHVVGSTTACWCRQMDFCNADLEAELFDVDDSTDDSETDSAEHIVPPASSRRNQYNVDAALRRIPVEPHIFTSSPYVASPSVGFTASSTTTSTTEPTTESTKVWTSTKRSVKMKINPAIRIDVAEKIKLTPQQKQQPPTVIAETAISDDYEDELLDDE
ncbi:unnamed protein product [Gongylonema pulchrum]|uniref:EB domain-containing protein n=1 Tax=Gongylonema pulchrum TaxID=637853 RepID=A0A183DSS7_9BILA|nr:unnamed protein product [Gongylonema pulchrum]